MPETARSLSALGFDWTPLTSAFHGAFTDAERARPSTVQKFWDEFVKAHRRIMRATI